MLNLDIYLSNCYFYNNSKKSFNISPFVSNSELKITYTSNNIIPTIESLVCEFFNNENLMSEVFGLYEFIQSHKDLSLFGIIVKYGNKIIFNGFIQVYSVQPEKNYRYTDSKAIKYDIDSIIHKSSELKNRYISKVLSYKQISVENYFNDLFLTNNKITKYRYYDNNVISENYSSNIFYINRKYTYNSNLIMVGDTLHINQLNGDTIYSNHVIKEVYNFSETSEYDIIDNIYFNEQFLFEDDIQIIIDRDYNTEIYLNDELIASGIFNDESLECIFSGQYSGKIIFKKEKVYLIKNFCVLWGQYVKNVNWGQVWDDANWGLLIPSLIISVNMSKMKLILFDNINFLSSHEIDSYIGYKVEAIDDSKDIIISNPIIKFNPALNLLDDMASDYLFNYSATNDGVFKLYTDTADTLENEDYILQIGNNPIDLLINSTFEVNNCNIYYTPNYTDLQEFRINWGQPAWNNPIWGQPYKNVIWGYGEFFYTLDSIKESLRDVIILKNGSQPYNVKFTINNLVQKKYIIKINTDAQSITLKCNNEDLELTQIDYYDIPTFTFELGENQDCIEVILSNSEDVKVLNIKELSIYESVWTDSEYDSVFSPLNISIDSSGLKTATNVTNFSQTQESEFIEQITSINPAINTYHKLLETPFESTKTYSTGGGDKKYIQLGRDLPSITFPILLDEESTFINKLSINTFRNTLTAQMCLLASFVKNSSKYIFNQIIPYNQIETSSLTLTPAFVNKKVDDKLECIIKPMIYETGKIITSNSFTSINYQYYIIGEKVIIPNNSGGLDYYTIQNVVGNTITLTETITNGTYDILVDKNNTVTGEYLELEINTNFVDTGDYIILGDIQNTSLQLVRDVTIQNSYVSRYPIENIGNGYNGVPNQIFLLDEDILTDTFKLVDLSGSNATGISFINTNEDYFQPLLDYNLVYIEIFNYSTNKWEVYKLDSYNKTNGTITITEDLNLTDYSSNNICQFRRIYITTTTGFESKPTDDDIYEAYITSDRYSFGFNYKVDNEAIQYLINGDTTKTKGRIYDVGNILTATYNVSLTFPRYLEDFNSVNKYGIIEDVFSDTIETNENYVAISQNQLKYNSEPVVKTDVTVHLGYLSIVRPDVDLTKIQLIRLYHEILPYNGLYAINAKQFSFKKSGIHTCKLSLEKIVGV